MTIADFIFGILIATPIIVSIITLSELLSAKRLIIEHLEIQNRSLATIMEAQRTTMNLVSNVQTIVMEERQ